MKNKKGSLSKSLNVILMFGIIGAVAIVLGILMQSLRDSNATATSAAYVIADNALNASVNTSQQLETVGTIVGIFVLVAVAVLMILLLYTVVKRFSGGGKKSGGSRRNRVFFMR